MKSSARRNTYALWLGLAIVAALAVSLRKLARDTGGSSGSATTSSTESQDPPAPATKAGQLDFQTMVATRAQARATWMGVAFTGVALIISLIPWIGQLRINEQQIRLNESAAKRDQQVYASRVSNWYVEGRNVTSVLPAGLDVEIQNRAPVAVNDIRLSAPVSRAETPQGFAEIRIELVPPCRVVTMRVAAPPGMRFPSSVNAGRPVAALKMTFAESGRSWYLDAGRLKLMDAEDLQKMPVFGSLLRLRGSNYQVGPLGDCSEGS